MIRAFVLVTIRSFRNRVWSAAKRLRDPRYLIAFLLAAAYFASVFWRVLLSTRAPERLGASAFAGDLASLVILALMVLAWALPEDSGGLTFSEAEIQFLFPAPLSRRQLVLYKIWRQQPQILISAALMRFFALQSATLVGVWLTFVTLSIYFTMVGLARARLRIAGIAFFVRLPIVFAALTAVAYGLWRDIRMLPAHSASRPRNFGDVSSFVQSTFQGTFTDIALFIPRFFGKAMFPAGWSGLALHSLALAGLAFLFLRIAQRLNVSFEASIGASERQKARHERALASRSGQHVPFPRMPPPFRLRAGMPAEVAILWKNLTAVMRTSVWWAAAMVVLCITLTSFGSLGDDPALGVAAATMGAVVACILPFVGTQVFAQDMRLDLKRIEVLKSYPIAADRLIAAEIAAPLVSVALLEMFFLAWLAIYVGSLSDPGPFRFIASAEFVTIALLVTVPVTGMLLLVRNASPILFPGWALRSLEEPRGFAVMGQRLLEFAATAFVLAVALFPGAIVLIASIAVGKRFDNRPLFLALGTVPTVALLLFELWMGVRFLGAQFEKIDVTSEVRTAGV